MLADLKEEKNILLLNPSGPCQYDGCDRSATDYAEGRDDGHRSVNAYCETHAKAVADEGSPEYGVCCPCCGCSFGVN